MTGRVPPLRFARRRDAETDRVRCVPGEWLTADNKFWVARRLHERHWFLHPRGSTAADWNDGRELLIRHQLYGVKFATRREAAAALAVALHSDGLRLDADL